MTFRPTHRVTENLIGFAKGEFVQRIGDGDSGAEYGDKYMSEDGRRADIPNDYLELLGDTKSLAGLVHGKRYLLTVEAIYNAQLAHFKHVKTGTVTTRESDVTNGLVSAELLPDPLPTTPGSVARDNIHGILFFCYRVNRWRDEAGQTFNADQLDPETFTVLFDAGTE